MCDSSPETILWSKQSRVDICILLGKIMLSFQLDTINTLYIGIISLQFSTQNLRFSKDSPGSLFICYMYLKSNSILSVYNTEILCR